MVSSFQLRLQLRPIEKNIFAKILSKNKYFIALHIIYFNKNPHKQNVNFCE